MEKVRLALYNHPEVEQIFTPWHLMSARGKTLSSSFKKSVVLKKGDIAYAHRNHLHFHIKLD